MGRTHFDRAGFEMYLDLLVTLHTADAAACDWNAQSSAPAPTPPTPGTRYTSAAQTLYASYRPSLLERISGRARLERIALKNRLAAGRHRDRVEYEQARYRHDRAHEAWQSKCALASRVLASDSTAYGDALKQAGAFASLSALQVAISVGADADSVVVDCRVPDDIIPHEEPASDGDAPRAIDRARYWALYRSLLCSIALRAARDVFAALPVARVVVNVGASRVDDDSGRREPVTYLAARISRAALAALPLAKLAPGEALKGLPHRMAVDADGLTAVEPLSSADQSGPVPRHAAPSQPLYR